MIDEVFHHAKALPDVLLDLKVHQDRTNKADAENINIHRQAENKVLLPGHHNRRNDQKCDLQASDENGVLVGLANVIIIKLQLLPRIPVQRLKGHRVGIIFIQVQDFVPLLDLLEHSLPLALSPNLKLIS